jgi:hypothetical protein
MNSTTSKNRSNANYQQNQASGMKYEIANELGVNLGPDATARENGTVGGEMTKRLVSMAKSNLNSK